jgi:hypothetical protein
MKTIWNIVKSATSKRFGNKSLQSVYINGVLPENKSLQSVYINGVLPEIQQLKEILFKTTFYQQQTK